MSRSTTGRILIVDDNKAIHEDFRKALDGDFVSSASAELDELEASLFGAPQAKQSPLDVKYEIDSALQGQEGLAMISEAIKEGRPYSLAFIDVRMPPGWDGIETTERIWRIQPDLQVVICSAYSDYTWEDIIEALDTADRLLILKKPFQRIEVRQIAHTLTRKWYMSRELETRMNSLESASIVQASRLEIANTRLDKEIQERKVMEAQLLQTQKLEAIGQLAAGIAHEINTPIQYIGDNVTFLHKSFNHIVHLLSDYRDLVTNLNGDLTSDRFPPQFKSRIHDEKTNRFIEQIPSALEDSMEGLKRVSEIVRAMAVFSRICPSNKIPIDLAEALHSTILVARSEWSGCATVTTEIAENLPQLLCFPGEFNQSILNLIINSAQAIASRKQIEPESEGNIRIAANANDTHVFIEISDTGCGIPENIRSRIFEPFFTTKEVGRGTGQGLHTVYANIIKTHGGSISFESEVGKGTTFSLTLPLR